IVALLSTLDPTGTPVTFQLPLASVAVAGTCEFFSVNDTFAPTTGLPATSTTVPDSSASSGTLTAGQSGGLCLWQSFSTYVAFGPPNRAWMPMPAVNTGSYGISGMLF